jgi:hypothetical protein
MRAEFAHEQAQTYLRQRNRFAVLAGVLGLTTLISLGAAVSLPRCLSQSSGAQLRRSRRLKADRQSTRQRPLLSRKRPLPTPRPVRVNQGGVSSDQSEISRLMKRSGAISTRYGKAKHSWARLGWCAVLPQHRGFTAIAR